MRKRCRGVLRFGAAALLAAGVVVGLTYVLLIGPLLPAGVARAAETASLADRAFLAQWERTDGPVASGSVNRSWVWGERPGERRYERFDEASGGARLVQYFDKARMEINDPEGDRASSWFVTNGRLVVELISGRVQVGPSEYEQRGPASIPIVGDPRNNPQAPTYAMLASIASFDGNTHDEGTPAPDRTGQLVGATFGPDGPGLRPDLARPETEIVRYEPATGHNVPRVFQEFLAARGPVLVQGTRTREAIMHPLFAAGYPITEPYWVQARVGGQEQTVLFQAFERRILSYTPANPDPWKVEMGNVGQHYVRWRYGRPLRYTVPPLPETIRSYETTLHIPTYEYEQALIPTGPGDAIAPYPRLDRSQPLPLEERPYRAIVVENRFLELTFLPEPGGRLYRAVDKTTGHNIFYQNPVIKPSIYGQRGWWLGVGGIEWAAPTEEHGYLEYLPWELNVSDAMGETQATTVRAQVREQQTGFSVAGSVTLAPDRGAFSLAMETTNDTDTPAPLQMWVNAMITPGEGNRLGPGLRFIFPTDEVIIHATADERLPGAGEGIAWPHWNGLDLAWPANWQDYLGVFSRGPVPFAGAYDTQAGEGVVALMGEGVGGTKVFGFSPQVVHETYTDDESEYVELWIGAQETFWDNPTLPPGESRSIATTWLPLHDIGKLIAVSEAGALGVMQRADGNTTLTIATAGVIEQAVVLVLVDGQEVFRTVPLTLRPDLPLAIELPLAVSGGSRLRVEAGEFVIEGSGPGR